MILRADLAEARLARQVDPDKFITRAEHNEAINAAVTKHGEFARAKATEIANIEKQLENVSRMLAARDAEVSALNMRLTHSAQMASIGAKSAFFGGALAAKQDQQVAVQMQTIIPVATCSQGLDTSTDSGLSDIMQLEKY